MKDYKLSDRLLLVAEWVKPKSIVADIGTDHAYLPIYLASQGICSKAVALDVRKKPLERAKEHIVQFGVSDKVEIRLSDGMDDGYIGERKKKSGQYNTASFISPV